MARKSKADKQREEITKAIDEYNSSIPTPIHSNTPCPSCGYCPTCGRRNTYPPYYDPFPTITWTPATDVQWYCGSTTDTATLKY